MIELIQFPWSPFCLVQRRILEFSNHRFTITNVPNADRTLVWRLTKQRYYGVPIIKDGRTVVFETDENSQIIAKYIDDKFQLGLFPREWEGLQSIIWRHVESEIEGLTFRLNDIYYEEFVPARDRLGFLRHKERRFGRGCIDQWRAQQNNMLEELTHKLLPYEQMLLNKPYLLDDEPRFIDFDLYGMLANLLYSGHYKLPTVHTQLNHWFDRIAHIKLSSLRREKLYS